MLVFHCLKTCLVCVFYSSTTKADLFQLRARYMYESKQLIPKQARVLFYFERIPSIIRGLFVQCTNTMFRIGPFGSMFQHDVSGITNKQTHKKKKKKQRFARLSPPDLYSPATDP